MIEVRQLAFTYKSRRKGDMFGIHDVSFTLEDGYLMCLFGKNGAGKSTLLRLLYGVLPAKSGSVLVDGRDIAGDRAAVRQRTAYVGDEPLFFVGQSVEENVMAFGSLYEAFRMEMFLSYLEQFEMEKDILGRKINTFSTGKTKLIELAFVLARRPSLILLDEPMANLDPVVRVTFLEMLQHVMEKANCSVILSTHLWDDVEDLVDYIGVLENGRLCRWGDRDAVRDSPGCFDRWSGKG